MGEQVALQSATDAGFDAIVGIDRSAPPAAAPEPTAPGSSAPVSSRVAPSRTDAHRPRAVTTLGVLLASGALLAGGLLVVSGAIPIGPAAGADRLAASTTRVGAPATTVGAAPSRTSAPFGTAAEIAPGVSVYVSAPSSYTPGRTAKGDDQKETVVYTVTLTNTGSDTISPALAVAAAAAGVAGSPITDPREGLSQPGAAPIEPGSVRVFRVAFSTATADTTLAVTGAEGRTVVFGG